MTRAKEELTRMNILSIDDDPVSHVINTNALRHIGVTPIKTAINGVDAFKS